MNKVTSQLEWFTVKRGKLGGGCAAWGEHCASLGSSISIHKKSSRLLGLIQKSRGKLTAPAKGSVAIARPAWWLWAMGWDTGESELFV